MHYSEFWIRKTPTFTVALTKHVLFLHPHFTQKIMTKSKMKMVISRLAPYWLAIFATSWTMAFYGIWTSQLAYTHYKGNAEKVCT